VQGMGLECLKVGLDIRGWRKGGDGGLWVVDNGSV